MKPLRMDQTIVEEEPEPWDETGLLPGYSLSAEQQEKLHKRLGWMIPDEVYDMHLTGHRVLIAPKPVSEEWKGLIIKPRGAIEREQQQMGAGWVIAVGPLVGSEIGRAPHPCGVFCSRASALLGREVIYQQYTGTVIKTSEDDTEFGGKQSLVVMSDRDLLQVGREVL